MRGNVTDAVPKWMLELSDEDWHFIKRFIMASGSLKDLAKAYSVSYPTVRSRLDRLIAKVTAADDTKVQDACERKIRLLVADGRLPAGLGKELLESHRQSLKKNSP